MLSRLRRVDNNYHIEVAQALLDGQSDTQCQLTTFWASFFEPKTISDWHRRNIKINDRFEVRIEEGSLAGLEFPIISTIDYEGVTIQRSGVYNIIFSVEGAEDFVVQCVCVYYNDAFDNFCLARVPNDKLDIWQLFLLSSRKIIDAYLGSNIYVVGGPRSIMKRDISLDDIILPAGLKGDIVIDFESFFAKGTSVYKKLGLNPFRKVLFAGRPGTGKTMLANALTNIALDREYLVVYVSSADQYLNDFGKIRHALELISNSGRPALLIVEEFDAYLSNEDSKAFVLNVLDGSETMENPYGTMLIATTNHPEKIDDRVLRRPGRMDRIFIIPETQSTDDAVLLLRHYLGDYWREEHRGLSERLVGQPAAVVRELVIHALTMAAYENRTIVSLEVLQTALDGILEQINRKDSFLDSKQMAVGFHIASNKSQRPAYVGVRRSP